MQEKIKDFGTNYLTTSEMERSQLKYQLIFMCLFIVNHSLGKDELQDEDSNFAYDSTFVVKINPNYPMYLINIHIEGGISPYGESACIFLISTVSNPNRTLVDTLRYWKKDIQPYQLRRIFESHSDAMPLFLDVNFDGYLDIRMPSGEGARGDLGYDYFLFEPKENGFKFSEEFTDVCIGANIDPIKKQIITTSSTERDCGYCWKEEIYKVENNHPFLYETVTSELIHTGGVAKQKETIERLINGKWSVVKVKYNVIAH